MGGIVTSHCFPAFQSETAEIKNCSAPISQPLQLQAVDDENDEVTFCELKERFQALRRIEPSDVAIDGPTPSTRVNWEAQRALLKFQEEKVNL